jgi:hypothetical protein
MHNVAALYFRIPLSALLLATCDPAGLRSFPNTIDPRSCYCVGQPRTPINPKFPYTAREQKLPWHKAGRSEATMDDGHENEVDWDKLC